MQKYGSKLELTSILVSTLENFQIPKTARTESEKFLELYRAWTSVHNDLLYAGEAAALNHGPTLDKLAKMLPSQEGKSRLVAKRLSVTKRGGTELEAMIEFLREEIDHQRALGWLDRDREKESPDKSDSATYQGECQWCGRRGHKAGDCDKDSGKRQTARAHLSLAIKPDKPCPCCKNHHSFTGRKGDTLYATRLASCIWFKKMCALPRLDRRAPERCLPLRRAIQGL